MTWTGPVVAGGVVWYGIPFESGALMITRRTEEGAEK